MYINKNNPPKPVDVDIFLKEINFNLPVGFIDFFKEANGAEISTNEKYIILWALTDMIESNKTYNVEEFAPEFFIFGSNGSGEAYAIEKETGYIYEMPFIGLLKEDAIFVSKTFIEFIDR